MGAGPLLVKPGNGGNVMVGEGRVRATDWHFIPGGSSNNHRHFVLTKLRKQWHPTTAFSQILRRPVLGYIIGSVIFRIY